MRTIKNLLIITLTVLLTACGGMQLSSKGLFSPATRPMNFPDQPKKIALLLPLQGPLGGSGKAVRNGFLAAYYFAHEHQGHDANIMVFDTSTGNVKELYRKAIQQGANVVVGPLTKANVASLASTTRLSKPTLALNSLSSSYSTANLFQFGLSPQIEAYEVANRASTKGYKNAIIIAPTGRWGQGIAQAFERRFEQNGGKVVDRLIFRPGQNLNQAISQLLKVNKSESRSSDLENVLGERVRSVAKRRNDFDVIFLAALPSKAHEIRPLLKYYFAGNVPVYTTSIVFHGLPRTKDYDLDGVTFSDMPWVLNTNLSGDMISIRNRIQTIWGRSYRKHPRLYALGIDAYLLAAYGTQMRVNGATGTLTLGPGNIIQREVVWGKVQNGSVKAIG